MRAISSPYFTPWLRNDDELHIRVRRSNAIGIAAAVALHLLLLFFLITYQKQKLNSLSQPAGANITYITPQEAPTITPTTPEPQRKPKPRPPQRRSTAVVVPKAAPPPVIAEAPPPDPTAIAPIVTPVPTLPTEARAEPKPAEPMVDMMASLKAQRAARDNAGSQNGQVPSPGDAATANINRNLASLSTKRDGTNGVFQILSKGTRVGQFSFNGWKTDKNNSWREVIEVDAGLLGDVELAIVRRMIELIRGHYQGDFNWDSHKLGRVVTLSARLEDTAGLEAFMLREFFSERR
jgi:hypothetical protein